MKTRSLRSRRGAADPVSLIVLAVVTVLVVKTPSGSPGKDHWWQFWRKNPVEQVEKADAALERAKREAAEAEARARAKVDAEREKQLKLAQDAAIGTGVAIAAAQNATAEGRAPVKELDTAAKINRTNTQAMEQAVGPADPARVRELELMVQNLNAGVAAGAKALELMQATLDRTVTDKANAQLELERERQAHAATIAERQSERDRAAQTLGKWALERDAIARQYERALFFLRIAGAAVALVLGYVAFLMLRVKRLSEWGKDAVGMVEMLKGKIREHGGPGAYAEAKELMRRDWMTVEDGSAKIVDKFKRALRV